MKKLKIAELFNREYKGPKAEIIFMSLAGTLSMSLMLAVINQVGSGGGDMRLFFLYIVVCAIGSLSKYYTLTRITRISEEIIRQIRVRLIDKLRHTDLQFLESIKKGDIYARIVQDTEFISEGSTEITNTVELAFTCFFIFVYIAVISVTAFAFSFSFLVTVFGFFFLNYMDITQKLNDARHREADLFDALNDVLSGFKEIRINSAKNSALFEDIRNISLDTKQLKTEAGLISNKNILLSFLMYEGLLAIILFGVPFFSGTHSQVVIQLVVVMVAMFEMLDGLARYTPSFFGGNVSAENLERLEAMLDESGSVVRTGVSDIPETFREIRFHSVTFSYSDKKNGSPLFTLSPIDLRIRQGDVVFITGGNGSGKSTLLKLLTGLYYPMADDGFISLDGEPVGAENYQFYRELFSIIFTDFHLFKKLYGLESVDENQVRELIGQMELSKKTDYADGRFTNIDLSTGQKKRLAYIAALLEDKAIYVFDEWAADQDPRFRKLFYEKFLDDLRAMNKTVIAVTHDDRYFHAADRILHIENGCLTEDKQLGV